MTVSVQVPYTGAVANGATTVFPYTFKILDADDLAVALDGVDQTSGYTVSGVGEAVGGNVTFSIAPANGVTVGLARDPLLKRLTDYQQFGALPADTVNDDFDRVWLALQVFAQNYVRALKLPVDTLTDQLIDYTAGERASSLVSFDANGDLDITPLATLAVNVSAGSFTTDTFSGDGSTTAFVLSRAPGIKGNTYVFVGGAYLRKDQYEISGTTITFDVAPASATDNIEVCQSVALEAGAPGDNTVSTASLQAGVLAVTAAGLAKMANGYFTATAEARAKFADKFLTLAKMADLSTGKIIGNVSGATGAPAEVDIAQTFPQIYPVSASVATNAMTLGLNPARLDFRSATLTTGTTNTRHVATAISLVVPDTATLGTVNAVAARLALLAIDNAGTVELAVVNLAGGNNLDETTLISTTAITTGADSANVIYSTSARTNVPFRVVGFVDIAEATAGTWATAPTLVQGAGGQSLSGIDGRTWQTVTGSRAIGTTYYNTTGKDIEVSVATVSTSSGAYGSLYVDGVVAGGSGQGFAATAQLPTINATVPPGSSYVCTIGGGTWTLSVWSELRKG